MKKPKPVKKLWAVGEVFNLSVGSWVMIGVFKNKCVAIANCKNENCFIGPINVDEPLPNLGLWPGAHYPLA